MACDSGDGVLGFVGGFVGVGCGRAGLGKPECAPLRRALGSTEVVWGRRVVGWAMV